MRLSIRSFSAFALVTLAGCPEEEAVVEVADPAATAFADATPEERGLIYGAAVGWSASLADMSTYVVAYDAMMGNCPRVEVTGEYSATYTGDGCTGALSGNVYEGTLVIEREGLLRVTDFDGAPAADDLHHGRIPIGILESADRSGLSEGEEVVYYRSQLIQWDAFTITRDGESITFDGVTKSRRVDGYGIGEADIDISISGGLPVTFAASAEEVGAEVVIQAEVVGATFVAEVGDERVTVRSADESASMDVGELNEETGCGRAILAGTGPVAVCLPSAELLFPYN